MKVAAFKYDFKKKSVVEINDEKEFLSYKKITDSFSGVPEFTTDHQDSDLIIFIANTKFFYNRYILSFLVNKGLRDFADLKNANENVIFKSSKPSTQYIPKPILTIYDSNVFKDAEYRKIAFGLQYLDSSIWQRWVDISDENFNENLKETISDIQGYHKEGIYGDTTAKEFCEFETRIFLNSYIADLSEGNEGHAKYVTPFVFGSESHFKLECDNVEQTIKEKVGGEKLAFNVLLVDDKEKLCTSGEKTRLDWIKELLGKNKFIELKPELSTNVTNAVNNFIIDQETIPANCSLNNQEKLGQKNKIDLILLDYLLGFKADNIDREKGISFLIKLDELHKENKISLSALDSLWVCLATTYSHAFLDDIKSSGLSLFSNFWVIEKGSSPIYTPYTLKYSILRLIEVKINKIFTEGDLFTLWENCLLVLVNLKFTRTWANSTLTIVLNYWSKVESIKKLENSAFAESLKKGKISILETMFIDTGFYGYLVQMLYLFSYSDGYHWEDIQTNLNIVKELHEESKSFSDVIDGYKKLQERVDYLQNRFDP